MLFGLSAGALTDRLDRRLIVRSVDLGRAAILALLTLAVATDQCFDRRGADALFVLAAAEVFADNSSQTLLPMLVAREDMALADSRLAASPAVRTLVLTIFTFDITFGAAWSVLVLYAT